MAEKSSSLGWVVASLAVAVLGIGIPIIWDIYKSSSLLELDLVAKSAVVSRSENIDGLKILFRDQPVQNLTRYDFILTNAGRTAILEKDIIEKPTISFHDTAIILDVLIRKVSPPNLVANHVVNPNKDSVSISFSLLNKNDSVQFSLLVDGASPRFDAEARVANIKELTFKDRTKDALETKPRLSIAFFIASGFTALFTLVFLGCLSNYSANRQAISAIRKEASSLPDIMDKESLGIFWGSISGYIKDSKLTDAFLSRLVSGISDDKLSRTKASEAIAWLLVQIGDKQKSDRSGAFGALLILSPAYFYIGTALLNYFRV